MNTSPNRSSLVDYAVSKLTPEVFSHPAWVRFGRSDAPQALNTVADLFTTVKNLQRDDPAATCQILLICAVYQNQAGQWFNAFRTSQQALTLAQSNHLDRETVWALWGVSAILIQHGDYEQARTQLVALQAALNEQNDWILAGFIEVFRQFLLQAITHQTSLFTRGTNDQLFGDLQTFTLSWLQQWGSSGEIPGFEVRTPQSVNRTVWMQFFLSIRRLRGRWRDLMLAIRGEIKLQWTVQESRTVSNLLSSSSPAQKPLPLDEQDVPQQAVYKALPSEDFLALPSTQETTPIPTTGSNTGPVPVFNESAQVVEQASATIQVVVHMLGMFSMTIGEATAKLPATRALSLLKYLLLHHKQYIPRDVLLETFWPEADPELARNNLNVSLHSLRRALHKVTDLPVVVFEDGAYGLASHLQLWLDVEEFEKCFKNGQRLEAQGQSTAAADEYEAAVSIYQGDLLEQNPYDEWTVFDREQLRVTYLDTLDRLSQIYFNEARYSACRTACQLILIKDPCREDAHCLLMRCYSRQGQPHLALYQYQVCVEALLGQLQVEPAPETIQLYKRIRRREQV